VGCFGFGFGFTAVGFVVCGVGVVVGSGKHGEITKRIQDVFFAITSGESEAPGNWLTFVNEVRIEVNPSANGHAQVSIPEPEEAPITMEARAFGD
jgi:hypothetical protein